MVRVMCLQQHPSLTGTSPCPSADLEYHLGHMFTGPEIRAEKTTISINDSYQVQIREMMTFSEHLGTYQYVYCSGIDALNHVSHFSPLSGGVTVDAQNPGRGKGCFQSFHQPLRA